MPDDRAPAAAFADLDRSALIAAVQRRDPAFDGVFVTGVASTGIYCRPTCPARTPKPENMTFHPTPAAARAAGYRACKRCRPDAPASDAERMAAIARRLEAEADRPPSLAALAREAGLSPGRLQRRFQAVMGVSPRAWVDAARAERFRAALKSGDAVAGAGFEAGYGSTSRIHAAARRHLAMSPSAYRAGGAGEAIVYAVRDTVIGPVLMAATRTGVCRVRIEHDPGAMVAGLAEEFPNAVLSPAPDAVAPDLEAWMDALADALEAGGPAPDLPLDLRGTAFQRSVWRFLQSIPAGETVSYAELAAGVGRPKAVRAAASACARNAVALLVPCHRVLASGGGIGGYRWGVETKRALLKRERGGREG